MIVPHTCLPLATFAQCVLEQLGRTRTYGFRISALYLSHIYIGYGTRWPSTRSSTPVRTELSPKTIHLSLSFCSRHPNHRFERLPLVDPQTICRFELCLFPCVEYVSHHSASGHAAYRLFGSGATGRGETDLQHPVPARSSQEESTGALHGSTTASLGLQV